METFMQTSSLLNIPPELRNSLYEQLIDSSRDPEQYTSLREAIQQQPGLLRTCRQLRREARAIYFGDIKLIIKVCDREISRVKKFLEISDDDLFSSLRRLSFEIPCCGYPEMSCEYQAMSPHSVVFDIQRDSGSEWEIIERHGTWKQRNGQKIFEAMRRQDRFGLQTCNAFGTVPVSSFVSGWNTLRFEREEVLRLIAEICKHPRVASRFQAQFE